MDLLHPYRKWILWLKVIVCLLVLSRHCWTFGQNFLDVVGVFWPLPSGPASEYIYIKRKLLALSAATDMIDGLVSPLSCCSLPILLVLHFFLNAVSRVPAMENHRIGEW